MRRMCAKTKRKQGKLNKKVEKVTVGDKIRKKLRKGVMFIFMKMSLR